MWDHEKSRRAGVAFVHRSDRPPRACASDSHSVRLRPTRAPYSTGVEMYDARTSLRKGALERKARSFRDFFDDLPGALGVRMSGDVGLREDADEPPVLLDDR